MTYRNPGSYVPRSTQIQGQLAWEAAQRSQQMALEHSLTGANAPMRSTAPPAAPRRTSPYTGAPPTGSRSAQLQGELVWEASQRARSQSLSSGLTQQTIPQSKTAPISRPRSAVPTGPLQRLPFRNFRGGGGRPLPRPPGGMSWGGVAGAGASGILTGAAVGLSGGSLQQAVGAGVGSAAGTAGGQAAGAAVGGAMGGPAGALIGGLIGSGLGGLLGGQLGQQAGDLLDGRPPSEAITGGQFQPNRDDQIRDWVNQNFNPQPGFYSAIRVAYKRARRRGYTRYVQYGDIHHLNITLPGFFYSHAISYATYDGLIWDRNTRSTLTLKSSEETYFNDGSGNFGSAWDVVIESVDYVGLEGYDPARDRVPDPPPTGGGFAALAPDVGIGVPGPVPLPGLAPGSIPSVPQRLPAGDPVPSPIGSPAPSPVTEPTTGDPATQPDAEPTQRPSQTPQRIPPPVPSPNQGRGLGAGSSSSSVGSAYPFTLQEGSHAQLPALGSGLPIPPFLPAPPTPTRINNPLTNDLKKPEPPRVPPPTGAGNGCRCNAGLLTNQNKILNALSGMSGAALPSAIATGAGQAASLAAIMTKLNAIQEFATKAWQATRIQKVLDVLTFIAVMHNAAMISREVGETMGYVVSNALAVIGIEDEEGNPINVNGWFSETTTSFLENLLGTEVYNGIGEVWNKANTILRSASIIIWTVRSIFDGTQEVLEWVGENTGKIGNALKKWGVVGWNAYPFMAERMQAQDRVRRRYRRIIDGLEQAEDTASSFAMVTGEVREIQEEISELGEQSQRFKDSVRDFVPGAEPDNSGIPATGNLEKDNAASPEISGIDMERADTAS